MRNIEVCCTSIDDIYEALAGGACRIELCSALSEGGITPSAGLVRAAMEVRGAMALNVMIRPRGGRFVFTPSEVQTMLHDIEVCAQIGVDGIVVGALTLDGDIDMSIMRLLVAAAKPRMSITFHRAFDLCRNPQRAVEELVALGCDRLLTSGQCVDAERGAAMIAQLVAQAAGRIHIMPGCGITSENIGHIAQLTGATEFHATARSLFAVQPVYSNPEISFDILSFDNKMQLRTDRKIVSLLVGE